MGTYLGEQAIGQIKLQWKGRKNQEVLDDPHVSKETKRKIQLIETYKKFFFEYFDRRPSSIYSKTTMLETKAVSYLVIASEHKMIKAQEFQFPFMGKFP